MWLFCQFDKSTGATAHRLDSESENLAVNLLSKIVLSFFAFSF